MSKKKIVLWLCILLASRSYSQTTYIINNDTLTCLNEKELDKVIGAFIDREACKEAFDTLSVGYDACMSANELCEQERATLEEDLQGMKVVASGYKSEKELFEKQLKKEIRKKNFNGALLYATTGIGIILLTYTLLK